MSNKVEYDSALNEASWVMLLLLQKLGPLNDKQFIAMKSCLKGTIEAYLTHKAKGE